MPVTPVEPPQLLNADQAAAWCGITKNTLNHLRARKRFAHALKIGRRTLWTPADLNSWLNAQRESA